MNGAYLIGVMIQDRWYTGQKAIIHQLATMLSTSKHVLFKGHNHLLTTARVIIKVLGHQHWWLAGGYDLEIGHF